MSEKRPFYERPLNYPPLSADVVVHKDIAYLGAADPIAGMDIYQPAGGTPGGGRGAVLFLHGGPLPAAGGPRHSVPWPKAWQVFQDYGKLAAANRLAGVVINHRYIGYEGLVQAISDVQTAVQFLSERGAEYGIDGGRVAVWLFSGAGMLLNPFLELEIAALTAFYPLLDLTHVPQAAEVFTDDELIALSPLSNIDRMKGALPIYVVRAGRDRPGLNRALDTFVKQAFYHNLSLEVRNLPAAGHGFDMLEESAAGEGAIRRGVEFMKENLRGLGSG